MLSRSDILRHLELIAQTDDDAKLREGINLLIKTANAPVPKSPGMRAYPATFRMERVGQKRVWFVRLHRDDAKRVEEVFADYHTRKQLDGKYVVDHAKLGAPKPVRKDGPTMTFRFTEVIPPVPKKREKKSDVPKDKAEAMNKLALLAKQLTPEQLRQLLK